MIQLIALIILFISAVGIVFIVIKKIPALINLPHNGHHGIRKPEAISKLEKKIKDNHFYFFEKQMLLHRLLSKTRILILKLERKIDTMLHGIRKNAQELENQIKKRK